MTCYVDAVIFHTVKIANASCAVAEQQAKGINMFDI